jgi:hypothetical protein
MCNTWQKSSEFSNSQAKKSSTKRNCKKCVSKSKTATQHYRTAHKIGTFECVVCGKNLTLKAGVNIINDLTKAQRKSSACSDKCLDLFNAAINYVNKTYKLKNQLAAKEIVISKWFERGVKQHEKDCRIQKGNAQRNAAA